MALVRVLVALTYTINTLTSDFDELDLRSFFRMMRRTLNRLPRRRFLLRARQVKLQTKKPKRKTKKKRKRKIKIKAKEKQRKVKF